MKSLLNVLKRLLVHLTIKDEVLKMPSKLCEIWPLVSLLLSSNAPSCPVILACFPPRKHSLPPPTDRDLSNLTFSMRFILILSCKIATTAWASSPHKLPPLLFCSIFPPQFFSYHLVKCCIICNFFNLFSSTNMKTPLRQISLFIPYYISK